MKREWVFESNSFDVATRTSCKKMLILATDTDAKLLAKSATDPAILVIYNNYHPIFVNFEQIYTNYGVVRGERKGKTLNIVNLLDEVLPVNVRAWEPAVMMVYPDGSPEFMEIFPNGRKPFNTGNYDTRINAVHALYEKLAPIPSLAILATQVQSFYNVLTTARSTQQQKEGLVDDLSSQREAQRLLLARALYGVVLAALMARYADDSSQIDNFFDLTLIRQKTPQPIAADEVIIKGKVTRLGDGTPVISALVTFTGPLGEIFEKRTTKLGNYKFKLPNVQPGVKTVSLKINQAGYEPYEHVFQGSAGNVYEINIVLNPAQSMLKVA